MNTLSNGAFQQFFRLYFERGLQVIPIRPHSKFPSVDKWSLWSAEPQPADLLEKWAREYKNNGIGLVCGPQSNIVALDIDLDLHEQDDRRIYDHLSAVLPYTPLIKKGKKGETRLYRYGGQASRTIKCGNKHVGDLLAAGRQTVLPPSMHPNGIEYTWVGKESLLDTDLAGLPELAPTVLAQIDAVLASFAAEYPAGKTSQSRNDTLKSQVIAAALSGKKSIEICREILHFDNARHLPPLFSDANEPQMKGRTPEENATRFVSSIIASIARSHPKVAQANFEEQRPAIPVIDQHAFYGLAGRIVKDLAPYTEADLGALLIQLLVIVSQVVGRTSYWEVSGTQHFLNQFVCILGNTADGRKGTGLSLIRSILSHIEPDFMKTNIASGFSSGEGLVANLRDATDEENSAAVESILKRVNDKRRVFVEEEFANVLKVIKREGNTLSGLLRNLWDGKSLQVLVKNNPMTASDPMCSIIAHCTPTEFRNHIQAVDISNGLLNRFLFCYSISSRLLPIPDPIPHDITDYIHLELRKVIDFGRSVGEMVFTENARDLWKKIYVASHDMVAPEDLSAITARSLPILRRLACSYAIFDKKPDIDCEHLIAALAIIDYSEATCRLLLGNTAPDRDQIKIVRALDSRPEGLTKTELIHSVFHRNASANRIDKALSTLEESKQITRFDSSPPRWILTRHKTNGDCGYDSTTFTTSVGGGAS
jgi:hypothetical protein